MQLPAHTDISNSPSQSGVPAFRLINAELDQVKKLIDEQLAGCPGGAGLSGLLGYLNSCSGKMIRPGLVLLAGAGCGEITDRHIRIAAIVEIIHNATLLHDDVIDEGQERRGLPTVNSLWGNESAVLLGDFLLSRAFKMCADFGPRVVKIIATTAARTCEGELRQIIQRQNWRLSESKYIDIITEKSAAFFSSSCFLGALLTKASKTQARLLADFGLNLGVAFQITDDLLDIVGEEDKTGKTLGSDVEKNKLTLSVIHLLRAVPESEKKAVIDSLCMKGDAYRGKPKAQQDRRNTQYDKVALAEILRSYGSLEYAHSRAQEFAAKAIDTLAGLKESDAKDALIETARFVVSRPIQT